MTTNRDGLGPHAGINPNSGRERLLVDLFDRVWDRYRQRVEYVRGYESLIRKAGATLVNDHIAFRTLAWQQPAAGIDSIARLFDVLGYRSAASYHFETKHLAAVHLAHPNPGFPRLFVSELKAWELSPTAREIIGRTLADHRLPPDADLLAQLAGTADPSEAERAEWLDLLFTHFDTLPWSPPKRGDVEQLNTETQYGAWVLVHGYAANHFTGLVNAHGVDSLDSIEKTAAALRAAGVPMKDEIEGEPGSKLRQTATEAVTVDVAVRDNGEPATMPWTYAYFELAERGEVVDPESGRSVRFDGFLGAQATHLFEMTRKS